MSPMQTPSFLPLPHNTAFLLIRLLNQIRNIDCKDREHHHSQSASSTESTLPVVVIAIIFDPTVVTSINAHHKASP